MGIRMGNWEFIKRYNYMVFVYHHCNKGQGTTKAQWAEVSGVTWTCGRCLSIAPPEVDGFVNLLEWNK